jgi:hypothetical protein
VSPSSQFWPRTDASRRTRDRIEIAYGSFEAVVDPETTVREDAPLLDEDAGTNVLAMREFARGNGAASVRVGGRFRFHRKTPVAIENRACLAEYDRGRRWLQNTQHGGSIHAGFSPPAAATPSVTLPHRPSGYSNSKRERCHSLSLSRSCVIWRSCRFCSHSAET